MHEAFVGVEAPLNLPLLPWNADPATGVGRKAMGRITALPLMLGTPLTGAIIGG